MVLVEHPMRQDDELAALRARLAGDVACERCGEIDPWQRCRD